MRNILVLLSILIFSVTFSGCSHKSDDIAKDDSKQPIEVLYEKAMEKLEKKDYRDAIERFETLDREYPFSKWAKKSLIMEAYAHYMLGNYDDTIVLSDRFVKQYPTHDDVAYAYYLKAMSYYDQISDVKRDQKMTALAQEALQELITRFPYSNYSREAKLKIALTRDHLAGKEMEIGRYYLHRKDFGAAIHRFTNVVSRYQDTTHISEALYRLTEAYYALGLNEEAKRNAAVLGANAHHSKWYEKAYYLLEGRLVDSDEKRPWYQLFGHKEAS